MPNIYSEKDVLAIQNHFEDFRLSPFQAELVTYLLLEGGHDMEGERGIFDALQSFDDDDGEIAEAVTILKDFCDDERLHYCTMLLIDHAIENME